jgi:diguanylate cyclase (GGDEF)-like protein/PAS domain S-box-containing protein
MDLGRTHDLNGKKHTIKDRFHADFYGFIIDSEKGLSFAGTPINLHPKEFNLLIELVRHANKRVTKEQLIANVWKGEPTSDESISRCLSMLKAGLRKASPGAESLIKTEYGQGYRFIGQIGAPSTFVNEENFFLLINAVRDLVILKDSEGRWQIANSATLHSFQLAGKPWQGKTDTELSLLCEPCFRPYFEEHIATDEQAWQVRQPIGFNWQAALVVDNGPQKRFYNITKTPLFEANGSRKALVVLGQDVTDRIEHEQQARLITQVLSNSDEAVVICDTDNNIVFVNEAFTHITGYILSEVAGKNPRVLSSQRHDQEFYAEMWRQILNEGTWHGEIWDCRKNGDIYPKWLNISTVHGHDGNICNFIGIFTDISKKKADEELLTFLAYHDSLTRLPNRLLLRDRFYQAVGATQRHTGGSVALLYLDLDRFTMINNSLGHEVGDRLLIAVAKRLESCIREIDTASRLSGDKFIIVLSNVPDTNAISLVAKKLLDNLAETFEIDQHLLTTSASIGIAIYDSDADNFDNLLKLANTASHHAKECGRNTYRFFTDKMNVDAMERMRMRDDLAQALIREEFFLQYQPQFNLSSQQLIGIEALIRWDHPESGLMLPGKFIDVAEETGQIVAIGEWVIREVCRQAKAWQQQGHQPLRIAVNLSALQFKRGDILKMISDLTSEHALEPAYLELELTESILLQDIEYILDVMEKFRALKFTLSIDDFGTGYSSLAYLKRFQVDKLKIDQSFIRNLAIDRHDQTIVRSIIQLAQGFGMTTIAEGIETHEQMEWLHNAGCHEGQGYFFSHPLMATQVPELLKSLQNSQD